MRPHLPHPPLPITHAHDLTPNACLACASCSFSGDTWNTNLIIQLTTGVASTVVYSVGVANPFEAAKITSVLWLIGVLSKLKDAEFDVKTLGDDKVETVVAAAATFFAFA